MVGGLCVDGCVDQFNLSQGEVGVFIITITNGLSYNLLAKFAFYRWYC